MLREGALATDAVEGDVIEGENDDMEIDKDLSF